MFYRARLGQTGPDMTEPDLLREEQHLSPYKSLKKHWSEPHDKEMRTWSGLLHSPVENPQIKIRKRFEAEKWFWGEEELRFCSGAFGSLITSQTQSEWNHVWTAARCSEPAGFCWVITTKQISCSGSSEPWHTGRYQMANLDPGEEEQRRWRGSWFCDSGSSNVTFYSQKTKIIEKTSQVFL